MTRLRVAGCTMLLGALIVALASVPGSRVISMSHLQLARAGLLSPLRYQTNPQPQASLLQRITSRKDNAEMILIPAGSFVYGIDPREVRRIVIAYKSRMAHIFDTELPKSTQYIEPFYIDRFEVTNEQYGRFLGETGHRKTRYWQYPQLNGKRQPVVGVGWQDATAYCNWAGKRLPSEEEWEKAARGTDGRKWPWGDQPDDSRYNGQKRANYAPLNVGSFPSGDSPYGVSDMAGNVWEMTSGTWESSKAMRGGSFLNSIDEVRVTVRWAARDEDRGAGWLGFRCVMDVGNVKQAATH